MVAALLAVAVPALAQDAPLDFTINEGGNHNDFFQSKENAFHVRLTNPDNPRLIVALPAGNSGVSFSFDPTIRENQGLRFSSVESKPWTGADGVVGADVTFKTDRSSVVLSQAILDSMRMSRTSAYRTYADRVAERSALAAALGESAEGWAEARATVDGGTIAFTRRTHDGKNHYTGSLHFEGPVRIEPLANGQFRVTRTDGEPLEVRAKAGTDYTPLTPLPLGEMLNEKARAVYEKALHDLHDPGSSAQARQDAAQLVESVNARRFLTYKEKILAGSHRFNTYFGRDTMLGTLLGWDMLTLDAKEAAVSSVLDRLSPEGIPAHEEDIGSMAEQRRVSDALKLVRQGRVEEAKALLADAQRPIYDYKMVDGEYLLPLIVEKYALDPDLSPERRAAFLAKRSLQGTSHGDLLIRALRRAVAEAAPYARAYEDLARAHPGLSAAELAKLPAFRELTRHLIGFHQGEPVGDWRDSNWGNGGGKFSGGINEHLVPHALDAIARLPLALDAIAKLAKLGAFTAAQKKQLEETLRRSGFEGSLERLAATWRHAGDHFKVDLTAAETRARLERFLSHVPPPVRAHYELEKVEGETTLGEWLRGEKAAPSLDRGVSFAAVALDEKGEKVPVLYSDVTQSLWFGDLSPEEISKLIPVLERPFPLGLKTKVGTVIANAALSDRAGDYEMFNRGAYHGNVIWSWQEAQLKQALARQIRRMGEIGGEAADAVRARLLAVFDNTVSARRRAGELANSELWSFEVKDGKLVAKAYDGASAGADSNPVQYWGTDGVATEIAAKDVEAAREASRSSGFSRVLDRGFERQGESGANDALLRQRVKDRVEVRPGKR